MQLSVLLMLAVLALPAVSSASSRKEDEPVQLDPSLKDRVPNITAKGRAIHSQMPHLLGRLFNILFLYNSDQTNMEWQTFDGSLPNGAISIYNGYAGRTEYVCQSWPDSGYYSPDMDSTPYCYYTSGRYVYYTTSFDILVNKDNFEFIEWQEDSYGSVPDNSVKTSHNQDIYVGKNQYGLGKVDVKDKVFKLPWGGFAYTYSTYQVLTINKHIAKEHIYEVKYKTDGIKPIEYPPVTMRKATLTNKDCQTVKETATLLKLDQVEERWDTSFSITLGAKTSITAGIPLIGSTTIDISIETTLQFTKGTTYTESTTHTVSVEHNVPPNHSCSVTMVGYKYGADIPYTARISRTYSNGETRSTSISGTYKSVQVVEVRGVVDRCEPLPHPMPCP